MRIAAATSAVASLPIFTEAHLALAQRPKFAKSDSGIHIDANENPLGPSVKAREAIAAIIPKGGRYEFNMQMDLAETFAKLEGLDPESVMPYAGSSEPLHYTVLAYTDPSKPLVIADPGYEAGEKAARFVGAKVVRVPLRKDGSHDVKEMCLASPSAGLIYVCNPNNPTGSVTRKEDIDYLVAHMPAETLLLLDEAYIHLSTTAETGTPHITAGKNVMILRTFSKLYGMAGLRAGAALGRPEVLERIKGYAAGALPVTGMVGATASLKVKGLVEQRRKTIADIREETAEWLAKKGFAFFPSEANMLMIDVRRPGREVLQAMFKEKVAIGRIWPSMPNHVRISIGTRDEMAKFRAAFARVMNA